jgi:hypothetical protein
MICRGSILTNVRKALATIVSVCTLKVIFFYKNGTEIFHSLCKGNEPSFQCEISLDRSTSMGETDGPYVLKAWCLAKHTDNFIRQKY